MSTTLGAYTKPNKKMSEVNLDALIPREDFIAPGERVPNQTNLKSLSLQQLSVDSFLSIYSLIKKPDFQRETNEWDKNRIWKLIDCFVHKKFIPAVIIWENTETGRYYVIDGSHRISAFLAYINDDYGDGEISHKANLRSISEEDRTVAEEARRFIERKLGGSYKEIIKGDGPIAKGLKTGLFEVQVVEGNNKTAEDSFFEINQQGVVITPVEKELCKSRDKPSCIATRAVIKGSAGHFYYASFAESIKKEILEISQEINDSLFLPTYKEGGDNPIRDHSLGGPKPNALPMIFQVMKIIKDNYKNGADLKGPDAGPETLDYLTWARKLVWLILSKKPGSLGLFPTVYFYNNTSKYIQSSFLGMVELLVENEKDKTFLPKFTSVRGRLESFIIKHKVFITQINRKYGSKERSHRHIKGFFLNLMNLLYEDKTITEVKILKYLKTKYNYLNERENDIKYTSNRFAKEQVIDLSIANSLSRTSKCYICGGHIHLDSFSSDHYTDLKFGGKSDNSNHRFVHVYCNHSKDLLKTGGYVSGKDFNKP